jgi:hypothetical protein
VTKIVADYAKIDTGLKERYCAAMTQYVWSDTAMAKARDIRCSTTKIFSQ